MHDAYQDIFEEFLRMCPYVRGRVITWYKNDDYEITVELEDGSAYRYDYIEKVYRRVSRVEDFMRPPSNEEEWRKIFSNRLYRRMRIKGITQDELAWRAGISAGMMTNYVNGYSTPSAYKLLKIANVLECSVEDLIYF